jgi:hypothetical protein
MVLDLVGGRSAEPRVGPVAVVPGEVEPKVLIEGGKPKGDDDEASRALGLERPDAPLDHGKTAALADGTEPLSDSSPTTAAPELLGDELPALV